MVVLPDAFLLADAQPTKVQAAGITLRGPIYNRVPQSGQRGFPMPDIEFDVILRGVQKPSRYVGGEWNALSGPPEQGLLQVALCSLEGYESGMASRELQWLYRNLNDNPGIRTERAFLPGADMSVRLRGENRALYALESQRPLYAFDVVVLLAGREAHFLNVVEMLRMAGLEPLAADRESNGPIVIGAGAAIVNWEPVGDFLDAALLGAPDVSVRAVCESIPKGSAGRHDILCQINRLPGVYVPSFFELRGPGDGAICYVGPGEAPELRRLRTEALPFIAAQVVPHAELEREGGLVDLTQCETGEEAAHAAIEVARSCGYQKVRLLGPATTDYAQAAVAAETILRDDPSNDLLLSLPPLDAGCIEGMEERQAAAVTAAAEVAFKAGWIGITAMIVVGHTQPREDRVSVLKVVRHIMEVGQRLIGRRPRVRVEIVPFVPHPGSGDERLAAVDTERARDQAAKLKKQLRKLGVHGASSDPDVALIEAVICRAARDASKVLLAASGEHFLYDSRQGNIDLAAWNIACSRVGFDQARLWEPIDQEAQVPWSHLVGEGSSQDAAPVSGT